MRYIIVDDSGSMAEGDGHRLIGTGTSRKLISSTRWAELTDAIRFHANFADVAQVPTEFRVLNSHAPILIGSGREDDGQNLRALSAILDGSPGGGTPLCRHINEVITSIRGFSFFKLYSSIFVSKKSLHGSILMLVFYSFLFLFISSTKRWSHIFVPRDKKCV